MVADLISKAPVNVSAAGVEDEVVSQMMDCPPHLIGLLIGRGGSTIKRIKEESRANVVINQKMMKVIVSGIPQTTTPTTTQEQQQRQRRGSNKRLRRQQQQWASGHCLCT
eukprot:TRINITY_DN137_c0_g1_i2.p2 TRINITY_DN137_c0_g1~~TRINITY_DN137_c0_g1_i2.p2  ORF type:complete len:110 (-),score=39.66 TRINITY_DN137_c0_g1_i2:153-482(-)